MNNNQGNLSPEEIRQQRVKAQKAKISKNYERKLFVIKHKKKILFWLKIAGLVIVAIAVVAGATIGIINLVKFLTRDKGDQPQVVVDEIEKPPADFAIKMTEIKLLQPVAGETTYDIMARIVNEDPDWGVSKLSYTFVLKDRFDQVVAEQKQNSFILPNQSRHLIEIGIETEKAAQKVELKIKLEKIQKLKEFTLPNIKIVDKSYQATDMKVTGELLNDSPYDFGKVEVGVILFDKVGEVIGLNFTNVNSFTSGSKRSFVVSWNDDEVLGVVSQVYVEPQVNVFGSGIFMNNYGSGQNLDY
ncbi:MAG: hypothetical protein HQ530_01030 [Parcubacteria group bacterium]|nr:hypothetical protein [Parcubacteria group bacterium]